MSPTMLLAQLNISSSFHILFPLAIVSSCIYALWGWYNLRRRSTTKIRSEESRSPPPRGRTLERDLSFQVESKDIKVDGEEPVVSPFPDLKDIQASEEDKKQLKRDKELYYKLQNLEDHPESVDLARTRLLELLDQTTSAALACPSSTVLSIPSVSGLEGFLAANQTSASTKYRNYLARRKRGSPRELFPSREFAIDWLRLAACVKYVDGSWIANSLGAGLAATGTGRGEGHSAKSERAAAKLAWQVISEEFGDGDLQKNHIHVYHRLIESLSPDGHASRGDVAGFDNLSEDGGSPNCWSAAVAQQCIGLLASTGDFFPEALGFNMAYETLPYHLLVTSYELRELRIDDYYFALHITIDNSDSGHGAMARMAVEQYLAGVKERDGEAEMGQMWKRVQAGVLLADGLPTTPSGPIEFSWDQMTRRWSPISTPIIPSQPTPTTVEKEMVALLHRKSTAAEHLHCPSRLLFDGHTLEHWLNPSEFTAERGLTFLRALSEKRPWVVRGDDVKSRLVRELQWGGRMFGAFTDQEVKTVRRWISGLDGEESKGVKGAYHGYVGRPVEKTMEATSSRFVKATTHLLPSPLAENYRSISSQPYPIPPISSLPPHLQASILLVSLSLLDLFPLHTSKFATPLGSTVLRIIRAQCGFPALHQPEDICSGTDQVDLKGLWEVAEEHFRSVRFVIPDSLTDLARIVEEDESEQAKAVSDLCADLLTIRLHPYAESATLLGLSSGMMDVWKVILGDDAIVERIERDVVLSINEYLEDLEDESKVAFEMGKSRFRMLCII